MVFVSFTSDAYINPAETGLYYLKSRYYDSEIGRFINTDAFVSTGTGLQGYNMYAYCNDNPIKYKDSDGNCITNARGDNIHHNCGYIAIDPRAAYGVLASVSYSKQVLNTSVTMVIGIARDSYNSAPKPNNVGIGTHRQRIEAKNKQLDHFEAIFKELMDVADFIYINGEIIYGIYGNCQNKASDLKIVWDAMVDAAILWTNEGVSAYVSLGVAGMVGGFPGVLAGIAVGIGIDILLGAAGDAAREEAKGWVN